MHKYNRQSQSNSFYLTPLEIKFLEQKLFHWRIQIEDELKNAFYAVQHGSPLEGDIVDQAECEREKQMQFTRMDMNERLLFQIDQALTRIKNGTYGYCEISGEPISFERLCAWPIATQALDTRFI